MSFVFHLCPDAGGGKKIALISPFCLYFFKVIRRNAPVKFLHPFK